MYKTVLSAEKMWVVAVARNPPAQLRSAYGDHIWYVIIFTCRFRRPHEIRGPNGQAELSITLDIHDLSTLGSNLLCWKLFANMLDVAGERQDSNDLRH